MESLIAQLDRNQSIQKFTLSIPISHRVELQGELSVPMQQRQQQQLQQPSLLLTRNGSDHASISEDALPESDPMEYHDQMMMFTSQNLPRGLVIFAHSSANSRFTPRNQKLAERLNQSGLATFLVDLLTPEEDVIRYLRCDVPMLSHRLCQIVNFFMNPVETKLIRCRAPPLNTAGMRIGLFGCSTGAAAAVCTAVQFAKQHEQPSQQHLQQQAQIYAVVSRAGRIDLAGDEILRQLSCPTLLIAGENDTECVAKNSAALQKMSIGGQLQTGKDAKLLVISKASHAFEEPNALEQVGNAAAEWFEKYLLGDADISQA